MSILSLPPELMLLIAENFEQPRDACALLRTSRAFAFLLQPVLRNFAIRSEHAEAALYWAAANGDKSIIHLVAEKGPEIVVCTDHRFNSQTGWWEWNEITNSIASVFVAAVLKQGPDLVAIDRKTNHTVSALHWAISNRDEPLFRLLMHAGPDLNVQDTNGDTPLHLAARKGAESAVRLLLQQGANSDITNIDLLSPVCCAPWGNDTLAALLLENLDIKELWNFDYVIKLIARNYGPKAIGVLLGRGVDVNFRPDHDITLLHTAIEAGNDAGARFLLENGADPKARDEHGRTPLEILFVCNGYHGGSRSVIEMGKLLVEKGADVNVRHRGDSGAPMLQLAIRRRTLKGYDDIVRWLLENRADPSAVDDHGRTALHIVAQFVQRDRQALFTAMILEYNVDLDSQDQYGRTALHIATKHQMSKTAIKLLLEGGANVNLRDKYWRTPLHLAAKHSKAVVGMLLDYGADVEAVGFLERPISKELRKYFSMASYCSFLDKSLAADMIISDIY